MGTPQSIPLRRLTFWHLEWELASIQRRNGTEGLSPARINHIMTPVRMILNEAADRYEFVSSYKNIKPLKVPKTQVEPFSLDEVQLILKYVRVDFKNYYCVRFLTGMRTGETHGLKWIYFLFSMIYVSPYRLKYN